MPDPNIEELNNISLHESAEDLVTKYNQRFFGSIVLQSKILAYQKGDSIVIPSHVEDALEIISSSREDSSSRNLRIAIGGAFFGASIQGFVTELYNGNKLLISIYVALGFIGWVLIWQDFKISRQNVSSFLSLFRK